MRDALDRDRQRARGADRDAAIARGRLKADERVVDVGRGRHRIEHRVRLHERHVGGAGDLSGDAARRVAVVEIDQSALADLAQHRRERLIGRGEARAHQAGDADIALEAAEEPVQPVDVLVRRQSR